MTKETEEQISEWNSIIGNLWEDIRYYDECINNSDNDEDQISEYKSIRGDIYEEIEYYENCIKRLKLEDNG